MNFGGIEDERYSNFDSARVLILPVSYKEPFLTGPAPAAERWHCRCLSDMELYEEETDAEVYKIGMHTLEEFTPRKTPARMMSDLHDLTKRLLESGKFVVCSAANTQYPPR